MCTSIIMSFVNRILTFIIVFSISVKCSRKYDINDEAHKLYQSDLHSVLQKFRRTPEYQKILEEKVLVWGNLTCCCVYIVRQELPPRDLIEWFGGSFLPLREKEEHMEFVFEAYTQILFRYKLKLQARLQEIFELDKFMQAATKGTTQAKSCFRMGLNFRKNEDQESEKDPGIAKLDKYSKFYGKLTLAERNRMKDLGFEYAGHVIHALIKAMGPEDEHSGKSTLQPYEDDELDKKKNTESTTTEHVQVHKVISTTEKAEEIPIETEKPAKPAKPAKTTKEDDEEIEEKPKKKPTKPTITDETAEPTQVYK